MNIAYQLVGAGWAKATVSLGEGEASVTASYLSNALGSLAVGGLLVLNGEETVEFSFDDEPGEHRWVLRKREPEVYAFALISFPDFVVKQPEETGKVVVSGQVGRRDFGAAVREAMESVLREYGEAGYQKRWYEHSFPMAELMELRRRLDHFGAPHAT